MKLPLLLLFVAVATANPIGGEGDSCSTQCTENSKFNYEPGKIYVYDYESGNIVDSAGGAATSVGIYINAKAEIHVVSKCEMILTMKDVSLKESKSSARKSNSPAHAEFKSALEDSTLRFSFQDGQIAHICPDISDSREALNVKRALLSALQNGMDELQTESTFYESDISGTCATTYKTQGSTWSNLITVTRTKDLSTCSNRTSTLSIINPVPYVSNSKTQSPPVINSRQTCTQELRGGFVRSSECEETHAMYPQRPGDAQHIRMTTNQKLSYNTERDAGSTPTAGSSTPAAIFYDHGLVTPGNEPVNLAISALDDVTSGYTTEGEVMPDTPKQLMTLAQRLANLNDNKMRRVWNKITAGQVSNKEIAERFFQDALPFVGTPSAIKMMVTLIKDDNILEDRRLAFLSAIAYYNNPSIEAITEAKDLLFMTEPTGFLVVSSLVHNYCARTTGCGQQLVVKQVMNRLQELLGYKCATSSNEEHTRMIVLLKAVGNIGEVSGVQETLERCITESTEHDIRVAALQAYRRLPCPEGIENMMRWLRDSSIDSEVRIAAYLAIMRCPSTETLAQIKEMLEDEIVVNQVGSFIWTHLNNLANTASPSKQSLREIVEDIELGSKFDLEKRKFSRNIEKSMWDSYLNLGATLESNIIMSPRSYVPRSANLNTTLHLFGHSVNLFEVGVRAQGMEEAIEGMWRPDRETQQSAGVLPGVARGFPAEHDNFRMSSFLRVFGNDIMFKEMFDKPSPSVDYDAMLRKLARGVDEEVTLLQSIRLIDHAFTVPTGSGLPLDIDINAGASLSFKYNGKLDLTSSTDLMINGNIKPSAAVLVRGMLTTRVFGTRSGGRMDATIHTSTEISGQVKFVPGENLNIRLDTPRQKQKLLSFKTQMFDIHKGEASESAVTSSSQTSQSFCSDRFTTRLFGSKMCADFSYHTNGKPFYFITGPTEANLYIEKTASQSAYELNIDVMSGNRKGITFMMDMPGANNRKIEGKLQVNTQTEKFEASLTSPWKTMKTTGTWQNGNRNKSFRVTTSIDEQKIFEVSAATGITMNNVKTEFTPRVQLTIPSLQEQPMKFTGSLLYNAGVRSKTEVRFDNIYGMDHPFSMSMVYTKQNNGYGVVMESKSQWGDFSVSGEYKPRARQTTLTSKVMYTLPSQDRQEVSFNGRGRVLDQGDLIKRSIDGTFTLTQWPSYNTQITIEHEHDETHADTTATVKRGENFNTAEPTLYVHHRYLYVENPNLKVEEIFDLKIPMMDINTGLSVKIDGNPQIDMTENSRLESKFRWNDYEYRLEASNDVNARNVRSNRLLMQWGQSDDEKIEATGTYRFVSGTHKISGEVTSPWCSDCEVKADYAIRRVRNTLDFTIKSGSTEYVKINAVLFNNTPKVKVDFVYLTPEGTPISIGADIDVDGKEGTISLNTGETEHTYTLSVPRYGSNAVTWKLTGKSYNKEVMIGASVTFPTLSEVTASAEIDVPTGFFRQTFPIQGKFDASHKLTRGAYEGALTTEWGTNKAGTSISMNLNTKAMKFEVFTPWNVLKELTVTANGENQGKVYKSTIGVTCKPHFDEITATIELDQGTRKRLDINFATPYVNYETMYATFEYEKLNNKNYESYMKLGGPKFENLDLKVEMTSTFMYNTWKDMQFNTEVKVPLLAPILIELKQKGTMKLFEGHASGSIDESMWKLDWDVDVRRDGDIKIKYSTPAKQPKLDLKITYNRDVTTANIDILFAQRPSDLIVKYSHDYTNGFENEVIVETPVRRSANSRRSDLVKFHRTTQGESWWKWTMQQTFEYEDTVDSEKSKLSFTNIDFNMKDLENIRIDVEQKEKDKQVIRTTYTHTGPIEDFTCTLKTRFEDEDLFETTITSDIKQLPSFEFGLDTTVNWGETYTVNGLAKYTYPGTSEFKVNFNDMEYKATTTYRRNRGDFGMSLSTPHNILKTIEISGNVKYDSGTYELELNGNYNNEKQISTTNTFTWTGEFNTNTNFKIFTHIRPDFYDNYLAQFDYSDTSSSSESKTLFKINNDAIIDTESKYMAIAQTHELTWKDNVNNNEVTLRGETSDTRATLHGEVNDDWELDVLYEYPDLTTRSVQTTVKAPDAHFMTRAKVVRTRSSATLELGLTPDMDSPTDTHQLIFNADMFAIKNKFEVTYNEHWAARWTMFNPNAERYCAGSLELQYKPAERHLFTVAYDLSKTPQGEKFEFTVTHPASDLDFSIVEEFTGKPNGWTMDSVVKYKPTSGAVKTFNHNLDYTSGSNEKITFTSETPFGTLSHEAVLVINRGLFHFWTTSNTDLYDNKNKFYTEMKYHRLTKEFDIKYKTGKDTYDELYHTYMTRSRDGLNMEAYHTWGNTKTVDLNVDIKLDKPTQLLNSKITWSPESFEQLKNYMTSERTQRYDTLANIIDDSYDFINNEKGARRAAITSAMGPRAMELKRFINRSNRIADRLYSNLRTTMRRAMRQDTFFIRTIYNIVTDVLTETSETMDDVWTAFMERIDEITVGLKTKTLDAARLMFTDIENFSEFVYNQYLQFIEDAPAKIEQARAKFLEIVSMMRSKVQAFRETLMEHSVVKTLLMWREKTSRFQADIINRLSSWTGRYVDNAQTHGDSFITAVQQSPEYEYLSGMMDGAMNTPATDITASIDRFFDKVKQTKVNKWEEGEIEFQVFVPLRLKTLFRTTKIAKFFSVIGSAFTKLAQVTIPRDMFADLYQDASVPAGPYTAEAKIIGDSKFITFDGHEFDFKAPCQYLLTRDIFDTNRFNVLANFKPQAGDVVLHSLTVMSGRAMVEITREGTALRNGNEIETPRNINGLEVTSYGGSVSATLPDELSVTCNAEECSVRVSGWLFAHTAGLFGTFNNESYDDLMDAESQLTSNLNDFASSWATRTQCRSQRNVA